MYAAVASNAVSRARRNISRLGKIICGEINMTKVNAMSAQKGSEPPGRWTTRAGEGACADAGRHHSSDEVRFIERRFSGGKIEKRS
jgi:hypothetical protein